MPALLLLLACAPEPKAPVAPAAGTKTSFLVVAPDTLRADRLDATRDGAPVMPVAARLAASGTRFPSMISNAGWTLPALAQLFGGRPPRVPEAEGGAGLAWLRADAPTLPEVMRDAGWSTAVFWGATISGAAPEFSRGFTTVHKDEADEKDPVAAPIAWLAEGHEPFFAVVHSVDLQFLGGEAGGVEINRRQRALAATLGEAGSVARAAAEYDATVTAFDGALGRLLDALDADGLADRTVVVLTSNHGVDLHVHGGFLHGTHYDSSLRVPLVVRDPAVPGGVTNDSLVQTIDLAPTVLARAGLPPEPTFTGQSLVAAISGAAVPDREIFSLCSARNVSVRTRTRKVARMTGPPDQPPRWEAYDLARDPDERTPVALDGEYGRLAGLLDAWRTARLGDAAPGTPTSDADRAALEKALHEKGYWEQVQPR